MGILLTKHLVYIINYFIFVNKKNTMERKELTAAESIALITEVIQEAKSKFRDNGFAMILIGISCSLASLGQFILLKLEFYQFNYYPYFIMPLAGIATFFYYRKKQAGHISTNIISSVFSMLGITLGLNFIISGFFFWSHFGNALIPYMLILFSIWPFLTGIITRNKILLTSAIVTNVLAYCAFFIAKEYHPLILSAVSFLSIFLPGLNLYYTKDKSHV